MSLLYPTRHPPCHPTRRHCLALLAGLTPLMMQRPADAATTLPLPLASEAPAGIDPTGYLISEKYDGVRALWDGNALRFRSGRTIAAPSWFLQRLPDASLDGELWFGRGRFDALSGLARRASPDSAAWREVHYMVFELPGATGSFATRCKRLQAIAREAAWPQLVAAEQFELKTSRALQQRLDALVAVGGEGLMLHRAEAPYTTGRTTALLKLKPLQDAEAVVIAATAGRGKHAGRIGALRLRTAQGVVFDLGTGLSDAQRQQPPVTGTVVTFSHHGFTPSGVPRFASFLRVAGP